MFIFSFHWFDLFINHILSIWGDFVFLKDTSCYRSKGSFWQHTFVFSPPYSGLNYGKWWFADQYGHNSKLWCCLKILPQTLRQESLASRTTCPITLCFNGKQNWPSSCVLKLPKIVAQWCQIWCVNCGIGITCYSNQPLGCRICFGDCYFNQTR